MRMNHIDHPGSCASCGIINCSYNIQNQLENINIEHSAWLLDESVPEFIPCKIKKNYSKDMFLLPWYKSLPHTNAYNWNLPPSVVVKSSLSTLIQRSLAMRDLKAGSQRQKILEKFDSSLANKLSKKIPYTVRDLIVWQNYVPFLQNNKTLGGRTYTILAWRPPRSVLHSILDKAKSVWTESPTIDDFRSAIDITEAEDIAFAQSTHIITANALIEKLFPEKTTLLPWIIPASQRRIKPGKEIVFLGPTLARNGAYSVRAACKSLNIPITIVGQNYESADFWNGVKVSNLSNSDDWLSNAALILRPAITDFRPRQVLKALSYGLPVIADQSCAISNHPNLHKINALNENELTFKIKSILTSSV